MARGITVEIHLTPGLHEEAFVAEALGNLASFELGRERSEQLRWQVLRVTGEGGHHFRLVLNHPDRILDVGLEHALRRKLDTLSRSSLDELRARLHRAEGEGLHLIPLRTVHESVDYWNDDFWNWMG